MQSDQQRNLQKIREYWNVIASEAPDGCEDHWINEQGEPLSNALYEEVADFVFNQLAQRSMRADNMPLRILELGCGSGKILRALQSRVPGAELYGIDLAEDQIRNARMIANSANLIVGDIEEFVSGEGLGLESQFDLIYAHSVTQYFPSSEYFEAVLHSCTFLLSQGGTLCLIDVPIDWYYEQMRGQPKQSMFTPVRQACKRLIGYQPKIKPAPEYATELLAGKQVKVPTFQGYWACPEMIEEFCESRYLRFRMEYQPFKSKPVNYRKYRPIFLLQEKKRLEQ